MVGSIKDYTTHLKLIIPRFDVATWHDFMESNFRAIDALFYNLYGINNFSGEWSKVTQYTKDQVIFIGEDIDLDGNHTIYEGRLVKVLQDHTTDNSDYFNIYNSLHPEYYQLFFDANNAEVFAENAFNYMNTTEEYKNFTESLKNLYEDYLNQTNAAKNDAQSAANDANLSKNEAETAANTAIQTVNTATDLLNEVEEFTQEALSTINTAKETTIETVNQTIDEAISTIQETVESAQETIDEKITTAEEELDDTIRTAIVEAKDEVKAEADKAIQNAGEIATNYAKEGVTTYTNEVIIPRIDESIQEAQSYAEQAQTSATNSQNSAENAESSANLASIHENNARDYASNASISANNAENSENNCREILERVGTVIKIIGRVDTEEDLPTSGNINGDAYLVGEEDLESYPEYYWYNDHWEFLGTTSTKISWEVINAALPDQTGNEGKSFVTNGTEASWQYGINYRGSYVATTQYYPGDVVQYYNNNSYYKYLCIKPSLGNTPSYNSSYWLEKVERSFSQESGEAPLLAYRKKSWSGNYIGKWEFVLPSTNSSDSYANQPTVNLYSGLLKVPAGIEGYYTSEQVDDLISTSLNYNHISNCVTNIPQNLKLEFSNGTVTLKAGSVITLSGSTYQTLTTTSDTSWTTSTLSNTKAYLFVSNSGYAQTLYGRYAINKVGSGSSLPADGNTYSMFFNTTDKIVYFWSDGTWSESTHAYPLGIVEVDGNSNITGFAKDSNGRDMIFNGAGFVGHHAFVYPNVKVLVPEGFNKDGSLKSTETETNSLSIIEMDAGTVISGFNRRITINKNKQMEKTFGYLEVDNLEDVESSTVKYLDSYVKNLNAVYVKDNNNQVAPRIRTYLINYAYDGTKVTDFTIRQPVRIATTEMLDNKQDILVSGANIDITNNTISAKDVVNYNNISNCITEIPQDIKLELNNGTLTLKAGSKVYVPNGAGVFDTVTLSNDLYGTFGANSKFLMFYNVTDGNIWYADINASRSGATNPSDLFGFFYNTTDNKVYYLRNTATPDNLEFSLPICIVTSNNTGITSIDQVFNGFGYIGSTVFALPGVKGLIPNGRNEDGTLKNIEIILDNVATFTDSYQINGTLFYAIHENKTISNYFIDGLEYRKSENLYYYNGNIVDNKIVVFATYTAENGDKITSITPKTPFHAVDYNDISYMVTTNTQQTITGAKTFELNPIIPSPGANDNTTKATTTAWVRTVTQPAASYSSSASMTWGSVYTCPANGYVRIGAKARDNSYAYLRLNSTSGTILWQHGDYGGSSFRFGVVPVAKGTKVVAHGGASDQSATFWYGK